MQHAGGSGRGGDDADDDSDGCSVGSDDTVSVAMSFMSNTTAVSLHPSRHCLERMLERDVDLDEMRVTKRYGARTWVGKGSRQSECRVGWRIVVPVRELHLPGRQSEAEITCWRNPITGMWVAPCGARYSLRHYSKLTSRGVVCIGVGHDESFLEIACGVELDTYYEYAFVSVVFEVMKPPRLTSFVATAPPHPRCMPLDASERQLHIVRPLDSCPQVWTCRPSLLSEFSDTDLHSAYVNHISTVVNAWQKMVAEPLSGGLLGVFRGSLTGVWQKPGKDRSVAMLHVPSLMDVSEQVPDTSELQARRYSALCASVTADVHDFPLVHQRESMAGASVDACLGGVGAVDVSLFEQSASCSHTNDQKFANCLGGDGLIFFLQIAPEDPFCELGIGHILPNAKLHLRRGDCEPKRVPDGPSGLLNHVLVPSADGQALTTLNTVGGDTRRMNQTTIAFSRGPQCVSGVCEVQDRTPSCPQRAKAIAAVKDELLLRYRLHSLARGGHVAEAAELLTSDAEAHLQVHTYADDGLTPLHVASREGHVEMADLLLGHGAAVDQPRLGHRSTPLHYAIQYRHERIVELLLKRGARVDQKAWGHLGRASNSRRDASAVCQNMERLLVAASPSALEPCHERRRPETGRSAKARPGRRGRGYDKGRCPW